MEKRLTKPLPFTSSGSSQTSFFFPSPAAHQNVFQNIQRSPGVLLSSDLWKVIESTGNKGLMSLVD